ncbi:hypothetical protein TanjilG_00527 [Lupinus angustifolius]|uniref:Uncharacterized protein n=1 Tax=Lupinus angustifolius TaxID=3871 RepID=A0A4P1QXK9_LUPAN|nr:hypothetical protein TanjilG_00527 [Lupinus angustifolius]
MEKKTPWSLAFTTRVAGCAQPGQTAIIARSELVVTARTTCASEHKIDSTPHDGAVLGSTVSCTRSPLEAE